METTFNFEPDNDNHKFSVPLRVLLFFAVVAIALFFWVKHISNETIDLKVDEVKTEQSAEKKVSEAIQSDIKQTSDEYLSKQGKKAGKSTQLKKSIDYGKIKISIPSDYDRICDSVRSAKP